MVELAPATRVSEEEVRSTRMTILSRHAVRLELFACMVQSPTIKSHACVMWVMLEEATGFLQTKFIQIAQKPLVRMVQSLTTKTVASATVDGLVVVTGFLTQHHILSA
jgi:hypothetical protein